MLLLLLMGNHILGREGLLLCNVCVLVLRCSSGLSEYEVFLMVLNLTEELVALG